MSLHAHKFASSTIFHSESEIIGWQNDRWLYPKAVQLLKIEQYRKPILSGLLLSVGSRTESTVCTIPWLLCLELIASQQRSITASLVSYAKALPLAPSVSCYTLLQLVNDILDCGQSSSASNSTVISVLQTFNVLLDADALAQLSDSEEGLARLARTPYVTYCDSFSICSLRVIFLMSSKRIGDRKNIQYIRESMKM